MLVLEICLAIFCCLAFFTMGVIIGLNAQKEKLAKPKEIIKDATTMLEERIEELKNAPTQMKFNPYYKGIYLKETV